MGVCCTKPKSKVGSKISKQSSSSQTNQIQISKITKYKKISKTKPNEKTEKTERLPKEKPNKLDLSAIDKESLSSISKGSDIEEVKILTKKESKSFQQLYELFKALEEKRKRDKMVNKGTQTEKQKKRIRKEVKENKVKREGFDISPLHMGMLDHPSLCSSQFENQARLNTESAKMNKNLAELRNQNLSLQRKRSDMASEGNSGRKNVSWRRRIMSIERQSLQKEPIQVISEEKAEYQFPPPRKEMTRVQTAEELPSILALYGKRRTQDSFRLERVQSPGNIREFSKENEPIPKYSKMSLKMIRTNSKGNSGSKKIAIGQKRSSFRATENKRREVVVKRLSQTICAEKSPINYHGSPVAKLTKSEMKKFKGRFSILKVTQNFQSSSKIARNSVAFDKNTFNRMFRPIEGQSKVNMNRTAILSIRDMEHQSKYEKNLGEVSDLESPHRPVNDLILREEASVSSSSSDEGWDKKTLIFEREKELMRLEKMSKVTK